MPRRRMSSRRPTAGKRAYRKRQRNVAVKEIATTAATSLVPGAGIVKTVHDLRQSINKLRRNI